MKYFHNYRLLSPEMLGNRLVPFNFYIDVKPPKPCVEAISFVYRDELLPKCHQHKKEQREDRISPTQVYVHPFYL